VEKQVKTAGPVVGGWAGQLLGRLRGQHRVPPRLALIERIALAPRHSLSLIEAEGRRILVATSAEGGPAFYALDEKQSQPSQAVSRSAQGSSRFSSRVSW
jgi:hypothetical protein